jgi:hypothetical protein
MAEALGASLGFVALILVAAVGSVLVLLVLFGLFAVWATRGPP